MVPRDNPEVMQMAKGIEGVPVLGVGHEAHNEAFVKAVDQLRGLDGFHVALDPAVSPGLEQARVYGEMNWTVSATRSLGWRVTSLMIHLLPI